MTLNTSGVCDGCHGRVRNTDGRRHPIERLTTIHDDTCPAHGGARGKRKTTLKGQATTTETGEQQ